MLAEISYANSLSKNAFGNLFSPKQLFEMATSIPAMIAKIDNKVGSLKTGLRADLFVLHGDGTDPFRALAKATPDDVTLVMIDGTPIYGLPDNLARLAVGKTEDVQICGATRALNSAVLGAGSVSEVSHACKPR